MTPPPVISRNSIVWQIILSVCLLCSPLYSQDAVVPFHQLDSVPALEKKGPMSYPSEFSDDPQAGWAKLWITVQQDGEVSRVQVIEALHPHFAKSAISTLLKSRFSPPTREGKAVATRFLVTVRYPRKPAMRNNTNYRVLSGDAIVSDQVEGIERPVSLLELNAYSADDDSSNHRSIPPNPFFDFPKTVTEGPVQYDEVPRVIKFFPPVFPTEHILKGKGKEVASVSWLIAPNGVPFQPVAAQGTHPDFAHAAEACIRYWKFLPGRLNGEPVLSGLAFPFEMNRFYLDRELRTLAKKIDNGKIVPVAPSDLDDPLEIRVIETVRYPLMKEKSSGFAVIRAIINEKGEVHLPEIVETDNEAVAWSAMTAMSQWRFARPTVNGEPVHVVFQQRFEN